MSIVSSNKRKQAWFLRKEGKSYNQINTLLNIPKSTLSTWFKNYPLSRVIKKTEHFKNQNYLGKKYYEF